MTNDSKNNAHTLPRHILVSAHGTESIEQLADKLLRETNALSWVQFAVVKIDGPKALALSDVSAVCSKIQSAVSADSTIAATFSEATTSRVSLLASSEPLAACPSCNGPVFFGKIPACTACDGFGVAA